VTRLIVCRHAEEGNARQARDLAAALADVPLEAVYTSPLTRAVLTAQAVAAEHELVPVEVADLREIERGAVDGMSFDEYQAELQAELLSRPLTVRFPGGETYGELRDRVCPALEEIAAAHASGAVTVVTHLGPIRAALAGWLGIPDESLFRIDQRPASVNVVDWLDGVPLIRLVNGTRPLGA
jgi:broad specificity phosphatase PhoE